MPHISDMIEHMGKYTYATCLDLSMSYYHLCLFKETSNLTTFMLPFGCYKYLRLPMGLNISPDVFQRPMLSLVSDLPFVSCYLDDIPIIFKRQLLRSYCQAKHCPPKIQRCWPGDQCLKKYLGNQQTCRLPSIRSNSQWHSTSAQNYHCSSTITITTKSETITRQCRPC
jgi:hypothetical protein